MDCDKYGGFWDWDRTLFHEECVVLYPVAFIISALFNAMAKLKVKDKVY